MLVQLQEDLIVQVLVLLTPLQFQALIVADIILTTPPMKQEEEVQVLALQSHHRLVYPQVLA
jgi:hypothetical protein